MVENETHPSPRIVSTMIGGAAATEQVAQPRGAAWIGGEPVTWGTPSENGSKRTVMKFAMI